MTAYELRHYWPGDRVGDVLTGWESLAYWQRVNGMQQLEELRIPLTNEWAGKLREWSRLSLTRNRQFVFHGYAIGDQWNDAPRQAESGAVSFYFKDLTEEAHITRVLPPAYEDPTTSGAPGIGGIWRYQFEYLECNGTADDVAKFLVRTQMTDPEDSRRRRVLVSCESDYSLAAVCHKQYCGVNLLDALVELGQEFGIWWRFAATATGAEFRTRYPLWGMDRRRGTANECVFDTRRGTLDALSVERNWAESPTAMHVRGQTGGEAQKFYTVTDADAIAIRRWREEWHETSEYGTVADLLAIAQGKLVEGRPRAFFNLLPAQGTYKTLWDVGDRVTVVTRRGSLPVVFDPVITGARIEVTPDGAEKVTEVEAYLVE
jgi:hypothetical protein